MKHSWVDSRLTETQNKVSKPSREGQSYCLSLLKFKLTSHAAAAIKPWSVRTKAPNGNKQSTAAKVPASIPKAMRKGQLLADVFSFLWHLLLRFTWTTTCFSHSHFFLSHLPHPDSYFPHYDLSLTSSSHTCSTLTPIRICIYIARYSLVLP